MQSGFFSKATQRADHATALFLSAYYLFGVGISVAYETWAIGLGVGLIIAMLPALTRYFFPKSNAYQYMVSLSLGLFMAQFIYQLHGMFEMHFFAFIGSVALIVYRNWKLQLPLAIFVVVHHASFSYLQNMGLEEIYFSQVGMDLFTFLTHASLAGLLFFLSGLWGYVQHQELAKKELYQAILSRDIERNKRNIEYAKQISLGNFQGNMQIDSDDEMGLALIEMQASLLKASDREYRDKYITAGLADIGEILRKYTHDLETLTYKLMQSLVKYLEAHQGGIFLVQEDAENEPYLELASCIAYDRKKFIQKRFEIGEGLVGQAVLEKDKIILTDIPEDFVAITSGLGHALPRNIVIIPLVNQDQVTGAIELASFHVMEPYKIEFLERVAQSVASTILNVKVNEHTRKLLEESQQMTEQLRAQEEEMRQNVEELQATQEEMARKEQESAARIEAIDNSGVASIEFDLRGIIRNANKTFLDLMRYKLHEIQGQHHSIFVKEEERESEAYLQHWEDLKNGIAKTGEFIRYTKDGSEILLSGAYSIIKNPNGEPIGVIQLVSDVTRTKKLYERTRQQSKQLKQQEEILRQQLEEVLKAQQIAQQKEREMAARMEAVDSSGVGFVEFDLEGKVLSANQHFLTIIGYDKEEVIGQPYELICPPEFMHSGEYQQLWKALRNGKGQCGEYHRLHKNGQPVFLKSAYSIIRDPKGNPTGILKLSIDISEQKRLLEQSEKYLRDIEATEAEMRGLLETLQEARMKEQELGQNLEEQVLSLERTKAAVTAQAEKEILRYQEILAANEQVLNDTLRKFKVKEREYQEMLQQKEAEIQALKQA
jgi:methyl-accepting chemotaxis protein